MISSWSGRSKKIFTQKKRIMIFLCFVSNIYVKGIILFRLRFSSKIYL